MTPWLLPAATVKGDAGEVVLPGGSPVTAILTEPVNPLCPRIETLNADIVTPAC